MRKIFAATISKSKSYSANLILILCLLTPLFSALVNVARAAVYEKVETQPMCVVYKPEVSSSIQPYIGGYMTNDYIAASPTVGRAKALRVTVSFNPTQQQYIQSDNWLMAGITGQGPTSYPGWPNTQDMGYIFNLVVNPTSVFVHAEVWAVHEWLPYSDEYLAGWSWTIDGLQVYSSVTLTMEWVNNKLEYYAMLNGVNYHLHSYTPRANVNPYFMLSAGYDYGISAKWFQFHGAWSKYPINTGWYSHLSSPGYKTTESSASWTDVYFAYITQGPDAYMDWTTMWGGRTYENVKVDSSWRTVNFYARSGFTVPTDTLLWDPIVVATKTGCDGETDLQNCKFYVPSAHPQLFRVKMICSGQTGDQTGRSSPYPTTQAYPDTNVNIVDVTFVSSKMNLHEGQQGWDSMADVSPDRVINILDVGLVARHVGEPFGFWVNIDDSKYNRVHVSIEGYGYGTYNILSDGLIRVPSGATSWLWAYYDGYLYGALIVFYKAR